MGLRLSFGVGPVRASVPLTSGRPRRARRQSYHAIVTFPDGSQYNCHHNHQTEEAAITCAENYSRRAARTTDHRQAIIDAMLPVLAAVNSEETAQAFVSWAAQQIREIVLKPIHRGLPSHFQSCVRSRNSHDVAGLLRRPEFQDPLGIVTRRACHPYVGRYAVIIGGPPAPKMWPSPSRNAVSTTPGCTA
jgi:hypothetical protein